MSPPGKVHKKVGWVSQTVRKQAACACLAIWPGSETFVSLPGQVHTAHGIGDEPEAWYICGALNCPRCQTTNRPDARFCRQCGQWLAAACPNCGVELPELPVFCDSCGYQVSPLAAAGPQWAPGPALASARSPALPAAPRPPAPTPAPAPSASLGSLQKFIPDEVIHKLQAARASGEMVGERRVVTMLFCDVKGSTAAAERLDPEDWTEVINGAFERMIRPVYQYEGTVARLMGDALLAFFGAPLAHEDDPERAVLAGLAIAAAIQPYRAQVQERWRVDLDVRVGINTGLVVVGAVGSDLRVEYSALGDAINLAARMEQTAAPGTVQVAHDTYKLIKPAFEFESLGGIEIKGKAEPVPAYRVLRPKAAPGRLRGIEGLRAEIVGREAELAALRGVLDQLRQGVGRAVVVLAEAGLGKSRLVREAHAMYEHGGGPRERWIAASGLSYESGQAYAMMRHLLREMARVGPEDSGPLVAEKLAGLLAGTPEADSPQSRQVLEMLLQVAGADGQPPLEGEAFKRILFRVVRDVWRQFAQQPGVVVADDLHWADPATVELLEHLLPLIDETPLVLILAMRPDRQSAGWRLKSAAEDGYPYRYTEVSLPPLAEADSNELVNRLLAVADLPDSLRERIHERAGGNPFFIEEVIRNLIESGAVVREERLVDGQQRQYWRAAGGKGAELQIPDNLQSLLTARIDRLEEQARRTVQLASVIGRSFYYKVLALLGQDEAMSGVELDRRLHTLLRAELIQEAARIPEVEYRFRNPLTQETAYQTILVKRRRELHRQVAEAFEALYPDRLAELTPRLSYHYREANMPDRALKYLVMAGDAAYRLFAITEALRNYGEALALAGPAGAGSDQLRHLYLRRGRALELADQYEAALANYQEMQTAAQARGDRSLELAAMAELGKIYTTPNPFHNPEAGERIIEAGLALARELGEGESEAKLLWNMVNLYRFGNRHEEAREAGERSLELARQLGLKEQLAYTLNDLFYVYLNGGQPELAMASAAEAKDLWRGLGNQAMLADNLSSSVLLKIMAGDLDAAIAASEEACAISQSIDNTWGLAFSQMQVSAAYWRRGQFERAIASQERAIAYGQTSGFSIAVAWCRGELARVYGLLGQFERALPLAERAIQDVDANLSTIAHLPMYKAELLVALGKPDEAETVLKTAMIDLGVLSIFRVFLAGAWPAIRLAQGRWAEAAEAAREQLELLHVYAIRLLVPETQLALAQAYQHLGQIGPARAALEIAQAEAESMRLDWHLWQILAARAGLEEADHHSTEAQAFVDRSREIIQRIAAELTDPVLRASLLAQPSVRIVLSETQAA
jgi:class 3 adenylate cyclase/tetratricopeptide (TPR) repeat protein